MAHIIVVGNEKGGSGKSTTSMHVATALVRMGHRVGALDLDLRQQTFGRYIENRNAYCASHNIALPTPNFHTLADAGSKRSDLDENTGDHQLTDALAALEPDNDFILIDCPGSHTRLSQLAHSMADTLITPLNDSFIDFDLLARIEPESGKITGPSVYSEMVWKARQMRAQQKRPPIDWIVVRNRVAAQQMRNKEKIHSALQALSKRIGFRVVPGYGERVIFRELFPRGLTLLDLKDTRVKVPISMSNITARQELRDQIKALKLPDVTANF